VDAANGGFSLARLEPAVSRDLIVDSRNQGQAALPALHAEVQGTPGNVGTNGEAGVTPSVISWMDQHRLTVPAGSTLGREYGIVGRYGKGWTW
jgi:hypothetical protein